MTKCAIYARYSSAKQNESSIEDQIRICLRLATDKTITVVKTYQDEAISGASMNRSGIQQMMADAQNRLFDIIIVEAIDRLSRSQSDIALIYQKLEFYGVKILSCNEGEIGEVHIGITGTMNAMYLKELANKTRRGQSGRIEKGKFAGGLCYGYDVIKEFDEHKNLLHGERKINEYEATIVVRIFKDFFLGRSPKAIAKKLNKEGIPGPRGKSWSDTTIRGHIKRGTGILNNQLYIGKLVWNRMHYIKNPETGRRVSRMNEFKNIITTDVPHLRIINDGLWNNVKKRQKFIAAQYANTTEAIRNYHNNRNLNLAHRPKTLFSGKVFCAKCQGPCALRAKNRFFCTNAMTKGICENRKSIKREELEERVLKGLKEQLVTPSIISNIFQTFEAERKLLNKRQSNERANLERKLQNCQKEIDNLVGFIKQGRSIALIDQELQTLEIQSKQLKQQLETLKVPIPILPENFAALYKDYIGSLSDQLENNTQSYVARELIRRLVIRINFNPDHKPDTLEIKGELANILTIYNACKKETSASSIDRETDGATSLQPLSVYV